MILGLFVSEHCIYLIKTVVVNSIDDIHPDVQRDLLIEDKSKRSAVLEFGMRVAMQGETACTPPPQECEEALMMWPGCVHRFLG